MFSIQISEKDEIIDEYESELTRFKSHYKELLERQEKIFALGPIDPERHLFLKENAEIVLVKIQYYLNKIENYKLIFQSFVICKYQTQNIN
jgi:hypothetical protein